MESRDDTLQAIAEAFAGIELQYKFAVSPHPTIPDAYRVVFSRPTFEAPVSCTFVTMDLASLPADAADVRNFEAVVENAGWPLRLSVSGGALCGFQERYLDRIWEQKCRARAYLR